MKLEQFRKRAIRSSLFPKTTLPSALGRMGFVQADPIRSPARAQDLILRHRVKDYKAGDLESKYPKLPLEEYFLFAYGIGSRSLWRHLHPKGNTDLNPVESEVLAVLKEQATVHPRDLERHLGSSRKRNYWGGFSRTAKLALESLHDRGKIRVQRREKGIRIYEAAPVQPPSYSGSERFKEIVAAALRSMGPVSRKFLLSELRHFSYLKESRAGRIDALEEMVGSGRGRIDKVQSVEYLSLAEERASRIPLEQVRVLAPFDPIVRDRERFEHLWGWEYRFEAYLPETRRKLGYYAMPVLWRDSVIGWCNASILKGTLCLKFGYSQKRPVGSAFEESAEREAGAMTKFLGMDPLAFRLIL